MTVILVSYNIHFLILNCDFFSKGDINGKAGFYKTRKEIDFPLYSDED